MAMGFLGAVRPSSQSSSIERQLLIFPLTQLPIDDRLLLSRVYGAFVPHRSYGQYIRQQRRQGGAGDIRRVR